MAVFAGIDEAGFGPILGPLVVSSAAFSVPDELVNTDLWKVLRKSVSDRKRHLAGRVLITDSKKAYSRASGIRHLQKTVLAVLGCCSEPGQVRQPRTLAELLAVLSPDSLERIGKYPWYENVDDYKTVTEGSDIEIATGVLRNNLAANSMEISALQSCCLDVAYYNKMVSAVGNKSSVLFTATAKLIKQAWDNFAGDNLHIVVDRQGGRVRYRKALLRMFPRMDLKILRETSRLSSYELSFDGRRMRLFFSVDADETSLPVSLASMTSKYLRELFVDNINRYFAGYGTDLKPTAGYWKDGLRFIKDIKTNLSHVPFDSNQLIRCR